MAERHGVPVVSRQLHSLAWSIDTRQIERACVLRGWSRRDLAKQAHVDPNTLSDLLARRRRSHLSTVQAVCEVLHLELSDVVVFGDQAAPEVA